MAVAQTEAEAEAETSQCHSAATRALALLKTDGLIVCRGCLIIARGEFLSVAQLLAQGSPLTGVAPLCLSLTLYISPSSSLYLAPPLSISLFFSAVPCASWRSIKMRSLSFWTPYCTRLRDLIIKYEKYSSQRFACSAPASAPASAPSTAAAAVAWHCSLAGPRAGPLRGSPL